MRWLPYSVLSASNIKKLTDRLTENIVIKYIFTSVREIIFSIKTIKIMGIEIGAIVINVREIYPS